MAVTIAELLRNTRTVSCEYGDITINLTYRPAAITQEVMFSEQPIVGLLLGALTAWDVYEDDAHTTMLPITAETLNGPVFGPLLLRAMITAIFRDITSGKV